MLYKKFQHNINLLTKDSKPSGIAIAVSGGSDSVALLFLANAWAKHNNVDLIVMSVDHHVRTQSKLENEYVKTLSKKLGRDHFQLHFDHQNNFSNFQERAREERYRLMTDLCKELDILTLLTAHHLNDYVENFCIRLERKSGPFGLSSTNVHWFNNTRIIRPLFDIPKQELINYLTENNITWFEDESNSHDKYQRNIIRKKLAADEEYNMEAILTDQVKINRYVYDNLNDLLIAGMAESVRIHEFGFANVNLSKFIELSEEVRAQLFSFLLITISGYKKSARFYSLNPILNALKSNQNFKRTLHGCVIKKIGSDLLIYREFGKKKPKDIILSDKDCIWDGRFYIKSCGILKDCYVTHLTLDDYGNIKKYLNLELLKKVTFDNYLEILFTMPTVKILEKVMAIPHISYYDNEVRKIDISFCPQFTSRFTHFC